jgi:hypothetical protein
MHLFAHAMSAVLRFDDRLVEKSREIINVPVGYENHVAAATAIAAVGAAFRDKFLAPKTDATAAAVSGLGKDFNAIDKHD